MVFIKEDGERKTVVSAEYPTWAEAWPDIRDSFENGGATDCAILDRDFHNLVGPESFASEIAARPTAGARQ